MITYNANDYDKFQAVGILISDTILMFFHGAHHLSLLNNVHAVSQVLHDMANDYNKTAVEQIRLASHRWDDGGRHPIYVELNPSANFLKHAKKDVRKLKTINESDVIEYMQLLSNDYRALRDIFLTQKIIFPHIEAKKEIEGFNAKYRTNLLVEIFEYFSFNCLSPNGNRFPSALVDHCPELGNINIAYTDSSMLFEARKTVLSFIEQQSLSFGSSGGMADYYMTDVARPILNQPLNDRSNPKPRVV